MGAIIGQPVNTATSFPVPNAKPNWMGYFDYEATLAKESGMNPTERELRQRPRVFMDLSMDGQPLGTMHFELYNDRMPLTCENFKQLCMGTAKDVGTTKLTYKDTVFHRGLRGFMLQGGDIVKGDGTGSVSIYGDTFADEEKYMRHLEPGILSMCSKGPNTNGSQFFITLNQCMWLDRYNVAFGKCVKGLELLKVIEAESFDPHPTGKLTKVVKIDNCGLVPLASYERELRERLEAVQNREVPYYLTIPEVEEFNQDDDDDYD